MFPKSFASVLADILGSKRNEPVAPSGFGRKHRAQVAAARVQPGQSDELRSFRQQFRANERKRHKHNAATARDLARQYAPHGTGCAGFHRSNS